MSKRIRAESHGPILLLLHHPVSLLSLFLSASLRPSPRDGSVVGSRLLLDQLRISLFLSRRGRSVVGSRLLLDQLRISLFLSASL